jgi:WD40 repeat protein
MLLLISSVVDALKTNLMVNMFEGNFEKLIEEDLIFGNKTENNLKEFQSFADFDFSKENYISALDWRPDPDFRGVVAVSCANKHGISDNRGSLARMNSSVILVWDFIDPIHPQLVLEAPSDVLCFRYHPKKPSCIVGGCVSGQVVFWDLDAHKKKPAILPASKGKVAQKQEEDRTLSMIPYIAASAVEASHKKPITDLRWVADAKVSASGEIQKIHGEFSHFVTVAADGRLMFWDAEDFVEGRRQVKEKDSAGWVPFCVAPIYNPSTSATYHLNSINFDFSHSDKVYLTSLEGEFICTSLSQIMAQKSDAKSSSIIAKQSRHMGPAFGGQKSPFFSNIFVTCGDWSFQVWKEDIEMPLITSPMASSFVTVARWSPVRPGVLFVGKADGTLDVWDLVDKSHIPSLSQSVCSSAIHSMEFVVIQPRSGPTQTQNPVSAESVDVNSKEHQKNIELLLAVGDAHGRLHVIEIPKSLVRKIPKEKSIVSNLFSREEARVDYSARRLGKRGAQNLEEAEEKERIKTVLEQEDTQRKIQEAKLYIPIETEHSRPITASDKKGAKTPTPKTPKSPKTAPPHVTFDDKVEIAEERPPSSQNILVSS